MMKRLLLSLLGCLVASHCWAAVALDTCGTSDLKTATSPQAFNNLTISGGLTNSVILALIWIDISQISATVTGVTWNGVSLSSAGAVSTGGQMRLEMWQLAAPASGNKTLNVTLSASGGQFLIQACSFQGVNQSTPTAHFTSATGSSTAPSTGAITSAVGDQVVGMHISFGGAGFSATDHTGITMAGGNSWDNSTANLGGVAANQATGAATVTLGATQANDPWLSAGIDIQASAGGAAAPTRTLIGVGK